MIQHRVKTCPVCGGKSIRVVRNGSYLTRRRNRAIAVSGIDYQECECCGEKFFDDTAMNQIEEARRTRRRKTVS